MSGPVAWWRVVRALAPGPGVYLEVGATVQQPSELIPEDLAGPKTDIQAWACRYIESGRIAPLSEAEAAGLGLYVLPASVAVEPIVAPVGDDEGDAVDAADHMTDAGQKVEAAVEPIARRHRGRARRS